MTKIAVSGEGLKSVCTQECTHGYESTREEGQSQYSYGLHGCAVLSGLFCNLRGGFGELDVKQIVTSALFGNPARTLRDLNVKSVVSLDDEIRDLRHCQ